MNFIKVLALRGPNIWANFPVLEAWVDLGPYANSPSDELPGFNERLKAWLPSLIEHRCSVGERGGFFERLRRGTYQAHIMEHVCLELQCLAGTDVGYGRARETAQDGIYKVVVEYDNEYLARAALETAHRLGLAAINDTPFDVAAEVETLRELHARTSPPAETVALLRAARKRRIPSFHLEDEGLLQLGHGGLQHRVSYRPKPGEYADPEAVLAGLFPEGDGRVPVVSITGTNGKTTTTRLIAHLLGRVHGPVGMTCSEGIYVGDRLIEAGDCSGPKSARTVLLHPEVRSAVLETARGGILREGLGFDRCHVAVVTNIGKGDHLGQSDIFTPEQLVKVKRAAVDVVLPTGAAVLNAAEPLVAGMAEHCRGAVIYFARDAANPVIVRHRAEGKKAVFDRDGYVILAEGAEETRVVHLGRVPLTHGGRVSFNVENTLAAAAAAWAVGLSIDDVRAGLESFGSVLGQSPGRFNLMEYRGATIVVDYAHNISALEAFLQVLQQFPHRKRSAVYAVPGDRDDEVIVQQGAMLGDAYDRIIIYEDTELRGRPDGAIFGLIRRGLDQGSRVSEILEVRGNLAAIEAGLAIVEPGELLVVQPEFPDVIAGYFARLSPAGAREITLDRAAAIAKAHAETLRPAGRQRATVAAGAV